MNGYKPRRFNLSVPLHYEQAYRFLLDQPNASAFVWELVERERKRAEAGEDGDQLDRIEAKLDALMRGGFDIRKAEPEPELQMGLGEAVDPDYVKAVIASMMGEREEEEYGVSGVASL